MRRSQKIGKITNEILYYLLEEYTNHVNIDIKENNNGFIITFTFGGCEKKDLELLKSLIKPNRDLAIEEYGSFLMGESDDEYDFELLGSMVDFYRVDGNELETIIEIGVEYE